MLQELIAEDSLIASYLSDSETKGVLAIVSVKLNCVTLLSREIDVSIHGDSIAEVYHAKSLFAFAFAFPGFIASARSYASAASLKAPAARSAFPFLYAAPSAGLSRMR